MASRVTLRACASPLLPQHLVSALAPMEGMGFGVDETQSFGRGYHKVALEACELEIAGNEGFAAAIKGRFYKPIQRPIEKLDRRQQFMALAPAIEICDFTPKTEAMLEVLLGGPFVITFRTLSLLEMARRTDEDPATTQSKLSGFVEHYLGCSAALFYERPQPTDLMSRFVKA
jgi:hypothetical protein